ncbi:calcineurin-like phosphoesterase C-terminal domain-containing protein [Parapedobacter deserti]|uniref:Calcineurin-like phosphoesterase C-terminal domain-containing protein n=1 Tax=Parapedobacter deserti TaxID=1912957 RepID=A0ABV7JHR2_9SPHI
MLKLTMEKWVGCLLVLSCALNSAAQEMATGYVFEDTNGNRLREATEPGVPKVQVSNGIQVAETDAEGRYELPVGDDNVLFVIKPAGYRVPTDTNNLPQFYYIHKPKGSPTYLKYKGVAPTGQLPKSVDFALVPQDEPDSLRMLILADPQPRGTDELYYLDKSVIEELQGNKEAWFAITLGDNVSDNLDLNRPYLQLIRKIGLPVYHIVGNHDANQDARTDEVADETFESYYGPANYSLNVGDVHLVLLDNLMFPAYSDGQGGGAGFREDQFQFIHNDLQWVDHDKLVVLAFHVPLAGLRDSDRQRIFKLLEPFPNRLILSGHTHVQRQYFYTEEDGWKGQGVLHEYNVGAASGNWNSGKMNEHGMPDATMSDGTPRGYAYATFSGNQYVLDYQVAGRNSDHRMGIYMPKVLPDRIPHGRFNSARVYVNYYLGGEADSLWYRINEGPWTALKRIVDYDPHYLGLLQEWDRSDTLLAGRRPSNASKSSHLWVATLPPVHLMGDHTLEIRVKDMFGRWFTEKKAFRVASYKEIPNHQQ